MDRLIAHVDMDAFYCSVEELDNPALVGRLVIVGGGSNRGVVSSANYKARKKGVHSAMPGIQARRLCPEGIFIPPRMKRYLEVSRQVMAALREYSPVVEPVSIDEAFLDLTGTTRLYGQPEQIGRAIKALVKQATGITCSIGLAPNKLVAKIASDFDKPDGLTVVPAEEVADFLAPLPVRRLPGVGPKLVQRLKRLSVATVADLRKLTERDLTSALGDNAARLLDLAWGRSSSVVKSQREQAKSISAEQTFEKDVYRAEDLLPLIAAQSLRVGRQLRAKGLLARTINIKIKHSDFKQATRSNTLAEPFDSTKTILEQATRLLRDYGQKKPVRLIGVGVSNLVSPGELQPDMFQAAEGPNRETKVDKAVDRILGRFGSKAISIALSLDGKKEKPAEEKKHRQG